jgi:tyrosine-protein kinase Etk/Wzc
VTAPHTDTIDLREVWRTLRRGWYRVAIFVAIGGLIAAATLVWAPRKFESVASVVIRNQPDPAGSLLDRVGAGDAGAVGLLSGSMRSPIETEIQILSSRAVVSEVVDSLKLQARVREPDGIPPGRVLAHLSLPGSFRRVKYSFVRGESGAYATVTSRGEELLVTPGIPTRVPEGALTLSSASLPSRFVIELLDREDATNRTLDGLRVGKAGGEVVRVAFKATDSLTAAEVPNAILAAYLRRKRTSDRGVNRQRAEFIEHQLDSIGPQLAIAEEALRRHQEASGLIDPEIVGRLQLERAGEIRREVAELDVERGAVRQMLTQVQAGGMSPRQIAAYPSFLKSGGLGSLLDRMGELEAKRQELLGNRTEEDPEVIALRQGIRTLEAQLLPMATAYHQSLEKQRSDLARQLDTMRVELGMFPAAAQTSARLHREVLRLAQVHGALQGRLVEARLAAISEGGDVRALDMAEPPKKVAFPGPAATMGFGLGGGLVLGLLAAILAGAVGRYMDDPYMIERATGIPTLAFDSEAPLLFSGRPLSNVILLIPLDDRSDTGVVAERLARTALSRATQPTVLDLSAPGIETFNAAASISATIERLEQEYGLVIVRLPGISSDATAAAVRETRPVMLVGPSTRLDRARLMAAVQTLRRLEVPCAGVVLSEKRPSAIASV